MNKQSVINIYKQAASGGGLTLERQAQLKTKLLGSLDNLLEEQADRSMEPKRRIVFPRYVMVSIFLVVFLFAGTVGAAQIALPGDGLYPLKRWAEKVEVSWPMSDEGSAKTYARQANVRLDELEEITLKQSTASADKATGFTAREELSRRDTQIALETALNRLSTIKLQLQEKHNEKAVEALEEIQAKLEARAGQYSYVIDVEKETGRIKVGPQPFNIPLNNSGRDQTGTEKKGVDGLENLEMEIELDSTLPPADEN